MSCQGSRCILKGGCDRDSAPLQVGKTGMSQFAWPNFDDLVKSGRDLTDPQDVG